METSGSNIIISSETKFIEVEIQTIWKEKIKTDVGKPLRLWCWGQNWGCGNWGSEYFEFCLR